MIGVLGGGLSGLALASHLREVEVLESSGRPGGLCRSLEFDGFTFDPHGSHILFSKDPKAMAFYEGLLGDNVCRRRRNTKVFYKGRYVKYPFENGLSELPLEDNLRCTLGYIQAYLARHTGTPARPANFRDWILQRFGPGLAECYLIPYNEKIWKTPAESMGIEWVDGRVPDPPLEDIIRSSIGIPTEGYTHQLNFLYPRVGGVESLIRGLLPRVPKVRAGFTVRSIRRRGSGWIVSDGREDVEYDGLVSTIPIPELIRALSDVPGEVRSAAEALVHRSLVTVMLGIDRDGLNDFHWVYFPTPADGRFNRISYPSNFSDRAAPEGASSAMAEITCDFGDETWTSPDEALTEHVVGRCDAMGIFRQEEVVASRVARTRHAYVVFDLGHRKNLDLVTSYLDRTGIRMLGRFGQFEYINTDQCILRAMTLARDLEANA